MQLHCNTARMSLDHKVTNIHIQTDETRFGASPGAPAARGTFPVRSLKSLTKSRTVCVAKQPVRRRWLAKPNLRNPSGVC